MSEPAPESIPSPAPNPAPTPAPTQTPNPGPPPRPTAPPTMPGGYVRVPSKWPGVFGGLLIGFGSLGLLAVLWQLSTSLLVAFMPNSLPAFLQAQPQQPAWLLASNTVLGVVQCGIRTLEIVAGVWLLKRTRRGWRLTRLWCWAHLGIAAIQIVFAVLSFPTIQASMMGGGAAGAGGPPPGAAGFMTALVIVSLAIGFCITASLPLILLWWGRRPDVREEVATWS